MRKRSHVAQKGNPNYEIFSNSNKAIVSASWLCAKLIPHWKCYPRAQSQGSQSQGLQYGLACGTNLKTWLLLKKNWVQGSIHSRFEYESYS